MKRMNISLVEAIENLTMEELQELKSFTVKMQDATFGIQNIPIKKGITSIEKISMVNNKITGEVEMKIVKYGTEFIINTNMKDMVCFIIVELKRRFAFKKKYQRCSF